MSTRSIRRRPEICRRHPAHRRDGHRHQQRRVRAHGGAALREHEQRDGHRQRARHRDDLAPRIHAPPEPSHEVQQSGARADLQNDVERVLRRVHQIHGARRRDEEPDRHEPSDAHVVTLVGVAPHEPAVEVVHEIRRAPVEVREDRRRIGRDEAADHQSDEAGRQELQHRRIRDVVAEQRRIEMRKRRLDVREFRIHDDRAERDQNPRPRPQHVVRDVEEEHGA